jgi:hypothetical protein
MYQEHKHTSFIRQALRQNHTRFGLKCLDLILTVMISSLTQIYTFTFFFSSFVFLHTRVYCLCSWINESFLYIFIKQQIQTLFWFSAFGHRPFHSQPSQTSKPPPVPLNVEHWWSRLDPCPPLWLPWGRAIGRRRGPNGGVSPGKKLANSICRCWQKGQISLLLQNRRSHTC